MINNEHDILPIEDVLGPDLPTATEIRGALGLDGGEARVAIPSQSRRERTEKVWVPTDLAGNPPLKRLVEQVVKAPEDKPTTTVRD